MSMQMDACFEKERSGALFVWVGALEGGFGGGGPSGVSTPKSKRVVQKKQPPAHMLIHVAEVIAMLVIHV